MPSLGDEFRVAREARGLSLSDVAEQLHIRSTYLQAIEEEDWSAIGAPVYVKGFLRTYARFLGIDPEHAIESLGRSAPAPPPGKQWAPHGGAPRGSTPRPAPSIWAWLSGLVALALLAYVGYGYYQLKMAPQTSGVAAKPADGGGSLTLPPTAAAQPSASPPPTASPQPTETPTPAPKPTGSVVDLRVTKLSWLRATVDGHTLMEGEFPPGTHRQITGKHLRLLVGNAGGVEVSVPGQPARILGSTGQVVERDYTINPVKHGN